MNRILSYLGWLIFLIASVNLIYQHGSRWELDEYGLPRTITSDGLHYHDGQELDAITAELVQSGKERTFYIIMLTILVCLVSFIVGQVRKLRREYANLHSIDQELRHMEQTLAASFQGGRDE